MSGHRDDDLWSFQTRIEIRSENMSRIEMVSEERRRKTNWVNVARLIVDLLLVFLA